MIKHLNITIYGQVQGVFFRASAKEQADKLGITGFAQNQPDGSVYIVAEGNDKDLDHFLRWCKTGPSGAKVEKIQVTENKPENFSQFEIS